MIQLEVEYFKSSGKWYMTENLEVPDDLDIYDLRKWITEKRPYKDSFIMVIDKHNDVIGFPMMDLIKEVY